MKLDDESLEKTLKEAAPELQAMRASPVEPPPARLKQLEDLRRAAFKSASGRSEEERPQVVSRVDEFLGNIIQFLSSPRLVPVCVACSVLVIGAFLVLNYTRGPAGLPLVAAKPVIQLAMLDTVGMTRGATPGILYAVSPPKPADVLQQSHAQSEVRTFSETADLKRWLGEWPADVQQTVVKVVYDRDAGEVRVVGYSKGKHLFERTFQVQQEQDLPDVLKAALAFVAEQTR